jgi:hypothetical protein
VQVIGDIDENARGFDVFGLAGACHVGERARARGTLEEEGIAVARQHAGCTVASPPLHDRGAAPLLGLARQLEDRGFAPIADGYEAATVALDRRAVGDKVPAVDVSRKHHEPFRPPRCRVQPR